MKILDKAVIKSDFKRYWWVSVLYILFMALFILPNAVDSYTYYDNILTQNVTDVYYQTDEGGLAFLFSLALTVMIFSYLHKGSAVSGLHALPIKRTTTYFSHIFTAVLLIIVPLLISGGVIALECVHFGETPIYAVKYIYTGVIYMLIAMMFAAFSMLIAGNTAAGAIFSMGFMILPGFVVTMANYIFTNNLYGYYADSDDILKKIYLIDVDYVWDKASIAYIIIIVVLFILNIWLYNIRNLENYDEVVAFKPLRSVFMYTVAVCFGYFGYALLKQILAVNILFWGALPLGCVALIAAFMLNRKSFNIKGIALPLIAYIVFVGIVKLAFVTDITGYEKRVPDIDKVVSVEPYENQYNNAYCNGYSYGGKGWDYYDAAYKGEITDKEGIGDIIALHSYIVDAKPGYDVDNDQYYGSRNFKLKYNLSNGRTMVRQYYISDVKNLSDRENFRKYYERPEYKKAVYPFVNDNKKEISFIEVSGVGVSGIVHISDIDEEKFTEAVKKDIFALTFEDELNISERNANISSLEISYNEIIPVDGVDKKFSCDQTLYLGKRMPNTLAFINEELKKYPYRTYTADDVTSIEISADYYNEDGYISNNFNTETIAETDLEGVATETVMDEAEYYNSSDSLERAITDKNDIKEIYNLLAISEKSGEIDTNLDSNYGDYWYISFSFISDKNNSGQSCDCTINVSASKVPEVLKKYLK